MSARQGVSPEVIAERLGVSLSSEHAAALERFVNRMLEWNARINLTGARSREELVGEHLGDAFALARLVGRGVRLVDVGSGGGLPAVPFGVLRPDVKLTLVEPRQKRVAFLRTAIRELGLAVAVMPVRVEALPAGGFDVACSRATFAPAEWLSQAVRLVVPGGAVVVFAARREEAGLAANQVVAQEVQYATAAGHPRWAGALVPRGT